MNSTSHEDLLKISRIISSPLSWSEAVLRTPETDENFKANYVERLILGCESDKVVIRVSRRVGKTYALAVLTLWACVVHKYYDVLVICPDDGQVSEIFEQIGAFIDATPSLQDTVTSRTKSPQLIQFKNGSTIKGKTTGASSKKEAAGLRGKGANLVIIDEAAYLAEEDFKAIIPIITGDKYKKQDGNVVRTFAASTPRNSTGRYYDWCKDSTKIWHEIHVPISQNPDFSADEIAERRALCNEMEWLSEQEAEFLDSGTNAFRTSDIESAREDYRYMEKGDGGNPHVKRALSADWDKVQAGVNILVAEWVPGTKQVKVIYREEVPKSAYTLSIGVQRVIALSEAFKPDHVYVDRGFGEMAVEQLKLHGIKNPGSRLHQITKGFMFNENIEVRDPFDGRTIKKQFKALMVNNMMKLLEDKSFKFSVYDLIFYEQLKKYQIISTGANSISTTRKNEHIIDAAGLACYAIYANYKDEIKFVPASTVRSVPAPKVVPSKQTIEREKDLFSNMRSAITETRTYLGMGRGTLSSKEPTRSKI